jgi:hypothetical protein
MNADQSYKNKINSAAKVAELFTDGLVKEFPAFYGT